MPLDFDVSRVMYFPEFPNIKFLGCYLAQSTHGSKVEAKESMKNSKEIELGEMKFKS
jgi:hypothetical protein